MKEMILSPLELIYIWNMSQVRYGNRKLRESFLHLIDRKFFHVKPDKCDELSV